jgi:hypothetical protein
MLSSDPWRAPLARNADASHEIGELGIGTYGIDTRVDLHIDQLIGVLAESLLERFERLIVPTLLQRLRRHPTLRTLASRSGRQQPRLWITARAGDGPEATRFALLCRVKSDFSGPSTQASNTPGPPEIPRTLNV